MSSPPEDASDEAARDESRRPPPAPGEATASLFFRRLKREQVLPGPTLSAGRVVGDFRLLALIGGGGMGQVWEAEQISLGGRRVAVKFLRPDRVTPHQLELFQREARAGGRLHHPGIVEIYAYGETEGLAWIAMELVDGAWTLRDSIDEVARSGEAPSDYDRAVARMVAEIADAMRAAHGAGVIHRDLKPQNVLIAPDERPKVTDFGLARISDEPALSQTGDFAGTYFYMSPEQITAKRVRIDHRTDVFSLGIILYEMLALRRPFQGDTSHQIAEQILVNDPPDPRGFRSRIPDELVAITGKALEKDRARRYASMADFADDLRRWLSHRPIAARPTPPWRRLAKWARRHPAKSSVSAVAVVALAAILALLATVLRKVEEFERLAAVQELTDLVAEADRLWPTWPDHIEQYQRWIGRAEALLGELPGFRAKREEYRSGFRSRGEDELDRDQAPMPAMVHAQQSRPAPARSDQKRTHARWWIGQLDKLIEGLEAFGDPETGLLGPDATSPEHGWSVQKRLSVAHKLEELAPRWDAALPAIRKLYREHELSPAPGLVPIGPDPDSGLWEFWHVASGEEPKRGPDGKIILDSEMGIVFVLVPGSRFLMGTQQQDPSSPNYDPAADDWEGPVHEVDLPLHYVSKFETTRAQWIQLGVTDPSPSSISRPLEPVVSVSWNDCVALLARHGLRLPTEEEWEAACRAGTATRYCSGDDEQDLASVGWYAVNSGGVVHPGAEKHASPWGLYDMHGNVWEWCSDWFDSYADAIDPTGQDTATLRVIRGGSSVDPAGDCSCGSRNGNAAEYRFPNLGFRVAFSASLELGD